MSQPPPTGYPDPHRLAACGPDGEPELRDGVVADRLVAAARTRIRRASPRGAWDQVRAGAVLIDVRPAELQERDGTVPGALPVARHVLEWRLDPSSPDRLDEIEGHDTPLVLLCSQGYSSSLAADVCTTQLGLTDVADVVGGVVAWRAGSSAKFTGVVPVVAGLGGLGRAGRVRETRPGAVLPAPGVLFGADQHDLGVFGAFGAG